MRAIGLLSVIALTAVSVQGQVRFTSLSPAYGPAGTPVVLSGVGFPIAGTLLVRVGGASVSILERTPDFIRFTVPPAATTGPVEVTFGEALYRFPEPFTVTRPLTVRFAPEPQIVVSNYTVGTLYGDAPETGPNYTVELAKGEATIVAASAEETDPVLLAIVTDADADVVLSAQSTALAMLYLMPGIQNLNQAEAARRLGFLAALPDTATLAAAIQARLSAGLDYLGQPGVEQPLGAAVEAFLNGYVPAPPAAAFAAAQGSRDDFVDGVQTLAPGSPRDLKTQGFEALRRLATTSVGTGVNERGLPVIKVKVKTAPSSAPGFREFLDLNPLDWMANLYELNPADADLNSLDKVKHLRGDFSNVYDRVSPHPVDRLHVKAKLAFRYFDLPELAADKLMGVLTPALLAPKDYLEVPADRSGLYMIRAFSGARFPPQAALVNNLPEGRREANLMTTLNVVLAAQDALGIILKSYIVKECFDKLLVSLLISTSQTVDREAAQGTLSNEALSSLFLTVAKSFVKDGFGKCVILNEKRKGLAHLPKVLFANINALGKAASVGKIAERIAALGNIPGALGEPQRVWMAQAIEDTIVVVGNPWQPRVTGFFPQSDYRRATVRIDGRNFSAVTNLNIVTFGVLTTDPTNPPVAARAEVLVASDTSLIVRVPENADTGFISVTVAGKGTGSTADLSPPFQTFEVLPDPVITGITPNPPVAGQVMQIHGSNFARITDRQELVFSAGPVTLSAVGSPTLLIVRAPNSTAPNSVKVRIKRRESNVLPFTPILPAIISTGATIYVSTGLDNTAADGNISFREAILLAGGGTTALGRALTSPPEFRPPGATYETDFVSVLPGSPGPGAATKDFIRRATAMVGTTVNISSPLPSLESFDDYDLAFDIDGGGGVGDGIRIIGKSDIRFRADAIRNFAGHGLLLSGVTFNNHIRNTLVEQCGGAGFRLEGSALGNTLFLVQASGCGQGLHLSGPGVLFNKVEGFGAPYVRFDRNQNFGVLIDGGASMNEVLPWFVRSNGSGGIRITGADTMHNVVRNPGSSGDSGRIHDNGGPGIWINSPLNIVRAVNVAGNLGDGILIEDSICSGVLVTGVRSGFDGFSGAARANQGSGLHIRNGAHHLIIGAADGGISGVDNANDFGRNYFGGNRDHGIWIEGAGTRDIQVNLAVIGAADTPISDSVIPNGTNGIAITGNAHSVTVGGVIITIDGVPDANVVIANHTNGAGIYLAQTTNNLVLGCAIGRSGNSAWLNRQGNKHGIHLTQGAFANVIGVRGIRQVVSQDGVDPVFDPRNVFLGNVEAGILLESGGDPTRTITPAEVPTGGNVIQNNILGLSDVAGLENKIGLLIRQNAIINRIGGAGPTEGNLFSGNSQAGILIDGAVVGRSFLANRIVGNEFTKQGFRVTTPGDPLAALPGGVGIAIINGAAGHVIGGKNPGEGNLIWDNYVGVQMLQSGSNMVIGNEIHRNKAGGIVLLQSAGNTVGPFNEIYRNGTIAAPLGGVVLKTSTENIVVGNWIGLRNVTISSGEGNKPYGIGVFDSPANLLGDLGGKNIIVGHTNGIVISGAASSGNQVAHNHIGFSPVPGVFTTANTQAGVLLANGAHHNIIGGERPVQVGDGFIRSPAPNTIQRNSVDGVRVDGAGTVGNSILYNSIALHSAGLGIQNINGGNNEIPPPTLISRNGVEVIGGVHPSIPDGSRVQFFSDNADEGRDFLGEEIVNGGQVRFLIPALAGNRINATVTHAIQGDTSEFAPLVILTNNPAGLLVQRVNQPPATIPLPVPGPVGVAVAFRLRALGGPVLVASVTFKATGSADESAPGTQVYLFRDEDRNARLSQTDFLLSGPQTFATNNANVSFTTLGRVIDPLVEQHWLLVLLPATNAAVAQTFAFEFPTEAFLTSRALLTGEAIVETGEFPLLSDTLVVSSNPSPPADLRVTRAANGELMLGWTGGGLLESAATVTGPWQFIPDASPPFTVVPDEQQLFFRFRP